MDRENMINDARFQPLEDPDLSTCHPEDARWLTVRDPDTGHVHVVPIMDSRQHSHVGCECSPDQDATDGGSPMFVHKAFDKRVD